LATLEVNSRSLCPRDTTYYVPRHRGTDEAQN